MISIELSSLMCIGHVANIYERKSDNGNNDNKWKNKEICAVVNCIIACIMGPLVVLVLSSISYANNNMYSILFIFCVYCSVVFAFPCILIIIYSLYFCIMTCIKCFTKENIVNEYTLKTAPMDL